MSNLSGAALSKTEVAAQWELFGPLPVLSSENKETYYKLCDAFIAYFRPTDVRHWSWIRELVDTQWEIFRYQRYRTAAIERYARLRARQWRKTADQILAKRKNQLSELYLPLAESGHDQVVSLQKEIAKLEATIKEMAQRKADDFLHSADLEKAARFVDKLDRWHKNATARRNSLLKILEYYCHSVDRQTEIPAAHCNEFIQDEPQQITAPILGPAAAVGDHVTTEHHPETDVPASSCSSQDEGKELNHG